jgi:predicted transposase YbfD/YdcC
MKSQIFKSIVPITILFELLEKICVKDDKCYALCKSSFKAAEYHNLVVGFCERIIEHYHVSKRYYVDRKMNYNKFITVVRQICGINNVSYTSKIVYNKSDYEILYYISKEPTQAPNGAGNVPSETGQAGNVPSGTGQAQAQAPNGAGNVPNGACNMPAQAGQVQAQAPNGAGNVPNGACNMQVNEAPVKKVRQRRAKKEKKVNDESNATPVSAANVSNATPVSVSLANTTPVSVSNANVSVSVSVSEANTNTNTTSNTTILQPQQVRHFQTQLLAHAHAIQAQAKALEAFITYSL